MLKKIFLVFVLFNFIGTCFSQSSLNDYKYVIVPNKYDFLKEVDKYQLNSLTKFLFNKYGFIAIMDNEAFPDEMVNNRCLALQSKVEKESGLLKTKLRVILKDCNNTVIFTSQLGETREKDYAKAYNLALRNAFKSFDTVNYVYTPNERNSLLALTSGDSEQNEVEKLKEEIKALKLEKEVQVDENTDKVEKPVVEKAIQLPLKPAYKEKPEVETEASDLLYAQTTDNGFQLVDSTPKVRFKIKESGLKNVFFVEGKQAIIYKMDTHWVLEYYDNDNLKQDVLNIKF